MTDAVSPDSDQPVEVRLFREELRRVFDRSGLKQSGSKESLEGLLGLSRSTVSSALSLTGRSLPQASVVNGIAQYCDGGDNFLNDYYDWVKMWLKAPDRDSLPPKPVRRPAAVGRPAIEAGPDPVRAEAPTASPPGESKPQTEPSHANDPLINSTEPAPDAARSKRRIWILVGAIAAAAVVAIIFWLTQRPASTATADPGGATTQQATSSVATPPIGDGPWPFVVVNTKELGLKIRTGPERGDSWWPGGPVLWDDTVAYADCQVLNDFDADPSTGAGGRWLRIHYPDTSSPADAFVYAGFTMPVGHNGDIPICPSSESTTTASSASS